MYGMSGMRRTKQREAIIKEVLEADGPLSVAEIHARASRMVEGLGIATVYRNVGALREEGLVVAVQLPGEEPRYEPSDRGHHHHFRCRQCDRTFDLDICPVGIPTGTMLPGGYRVEDHNLTLYGQCSSCLS